jgi:single-strand DNA-binding protein
MAGSVNKVILIGNLGADPEIRRTQDGRPIANLRVATSESWKDKSNRRTQGKDRVAPRRHLQRKPVPDCRAIPQEGLEGFHRRSLQTRKWQDQSGQDRYSTEVVLQGFRGELTLLDSRRQGSASGGGDYRDRTTPAAISARSGPTRKVAGAAAGARSPRGDMDDEIPF